MATREAIRAIPQTIREGFVRRGRDELADGAGPHPAVFDAGILTGIIIGMARAIGETAPIITIGALTFIAFLPKRRLRGIRLPACSTGSCRRSR